MRRHKETTKHTSSLLAGDGPKLAVQNDAIQTASAGGPNAAFADAERSDIIADGEIAPVAYGLWLDRGRPHGTDQADWFEAERRLQEERARRTHSAQSFVAEQAREAVESRRAREALAGNRERMIDIGRGNQQAGRQGS